MVKKLKRRANPLSELHFIANVSLEQAVMLIQNLADDTYIVTLTEVDADTFKFEIDKARQRSRQSKINGTLQRWQGTETRIDATGDVIRSSMPGKTQSFILLMFSFLIVGFFILADGIRNGVEHDLVCALPAFGIIIIGAALFRTLQFAPEDDNDTALPIQFRERDRLLQLVINTFKAAATVEAYEPTTQSENIAFLSDESQHKAKNL